MHSLENIAIFIETMNKENSRKYKEETLRSYSDNNIVRTFLYYMYNPFLVTGISRKKIEFIPDKEYQVETFDDILDILNWLFVNNTGNNTCLATIYYFMQQVPEEYKEVVKLILTKNIQLGVEAVTINKIFPKLIPTFEIQLAEKYFDHPEIIQGRKFTLTTKIDGGRIIAIKQNGNVRFFTRAGQPYEGLIDIQKELEAHPLRDFVLDGEITLLDKGNLTSKEQYKETMKITRKDGEKHGVKILAFDYLTPSAFESKYDDTPYSLRRAMLTELFSNLKYVTVLPALYSGDDESVILKYLDEQTSNGEEGVMINFNDAPYRFKRTLDLLKVKKMKDIDLRIEGFEEGKNRHTGELGAFLVNYFDNIVKVGTGLSDELRKEVWNNQDKYLGKIISIKYFEETTNDKGGRSLRFPVFVDFRYDKDEADDERQMFEDEHKLDRV